MMITNGVLDMESLSALIVQALTIKVQQHVDNGNFNIPQLSAKEVGLFVDGAQYLALHLLVTKQWPYLIRSDNQF